MPEQTGQMDAVKQPDNANIQPSDNAKPNVPQTEQGLTSATEIPVDKLGNKKPLGEIIRDYHLGQLYKKRQSDFDKAQSENQKLQNQLQELEAWKARREQEELVGEQVRRKMQENREDQDNDWNDNETPNNAIDENNFVHVVGELIRKGVSEELRKRGLQENDIISTPEKTRNDIQEFYRQQEAMQAEEKELKGWLEMAFDDDANKYREKYGKVLSDSEINSILKNRDRSIMQQRAAETSILRPESRQEAIDYLLESRKTFDDVIEKVADAKIRAEEQARLEELDQQLTTGQFPGAEELKVADTSKLILDPKEQQERRRKIVEMSAKKADMKDQARRAKGFGR